MKQLLCALLIAAPTVSSADMMRVVSDHILPAHQSFAQATEALVIATQTCDDAAARIGYHAAFDAWMGVGHIQFGPMEAQGVSLAIAFWPDPKNQTEKALSRLIAAQDPAVENATDFAEVSVAAQGLMALENMLYTDKDADAYSCKVTQAIAVQLAQNADLLADAWENDHGAVLIAAGPDNATYQSPAEAQRVVYTALFTGLQFLHDQRLGRPLGSFDRPRPARAETWRSGRSARNIVLSLQTLDGLATSLAGADLPKTKAAFAEAILRAEALDDPALQGVADPARRFRVEVLQQKVALIQAAVAEEIGAALGVRAGFNALDGD